MLSAIVWTYFLPYKSEVKRMSRENSVKEAILAKAAILFCQKTYAAFPGSVVEAIDQHYSDEDLTLEIYVPEGTDVISI